MNCENEIYTEYEILAVDGRACGWTHDSKDPKLADTSLEAFESATGYTRSELDSAFENKTTIRLNEWYDKPFNVQRYSVDPKTIPRGPVRIH